MATTPISAIESIQAASSVQPPVTNPHNLVAVYSNNFAVSATMTDFTIYFFEVGQTPEGTTSVQKQELKAIVTLPLAAAGGIQHVLQQVTEQASEAMKTLQTTLKPRANARGKK